MECGAVAACIVRLPACAASVKCRSRGPNTRCSPRHRMPLHSRNEGSTVWMTWPASAWQILLTTSQDAISHKKRGSIVWWMTRRVLYARPYRRRCSACGVKGAAAERRTWREGLCQSLLASQRMPWNSASLRCPNSTLNAVWCSPRPPCACTHALLACRQLPRRHPAPACRRRVLLVTGIMEGAHAPAVVADAPL